jgi:outer membrane protein TolC
MKKIFLLAVFILILTPLLWAESVLTLDDCQERAFKANSNLLQSRLDVDKTGLTVKQRYSDLYPSVSGRLSTNASWSEKSGVKVDNNGYTLSGTVNQNIYYPGLFSALKAAKFSEEIAGLNLREAMQVLKASVINLYFSILASNELIAVYGENIRFAEENLKRVRIMYELGSRTESDLLKIEVQKGQFETQLLTEEQRNSSLRRQLNILMGQNPMEAFVLQPIKPAVSELPDIETARKHMIDNNPSLLTLKKQIEIQKINIKIRQESYFPTVSGNYTYSYSDDDAGKLTSNSVGLSASIQLFNGFNRSTEKQKADIDLKRLELQQESLIRDNLSTLEGLYQTLETYRKMEKIHEISLRSAQRDYDLVSRQLEIGSGTILDQLDAQLSVLSSESRLVETRYNTKITEAQINQLLGM